jgi:hypothetical protein
MKPGQKLAVRQAGTTGIHHGDVVMAKKRGRASAMRLVEQASRPRRVRGLYRGRPRTIKESK